MRRSVFARHVMAPVVGLVLMALGCDDNEDARGAGSGGQASAGGSGGQGAADAGHGLAGNGGADGTDGGAPSPAEPVRFIVTVRNTSTSDASVPVVFGPGVYLVHSGDPPWFEEGEPASPGLERLAEDGFIDVALSEVEARSGVRSGFFGADDVGASYDEAPILPGMTADFEFFAVPSDRVEFGMMWSQSNDVFVATEPGGIALFEGQTPREGLVTSGVALWDAGTEVNQAPGAGDAQGPRQPEPGYGTPEGGTVTVIADGTDGAGYSYPPLSQTLEVAISVVRP